MVEDPPLHSVVIFRGITVYLIDCIMSLRRFLL